MTEAGIADEEDSSQNSHSSSRSSSHSSNSSTSESNNNENEEIDGALTMYVQRESEMLYSFARDSDQKVIESGNLPSPRSSNAKSDSPTTGSRYL